MSSPIRVPPLERPAPRRLSEQTFEAVTRTIQELSNKVKQAIKSSALREPSNLDRVDGRPVIAVRRSQRPPPTPSANPVNTTPPLLPSSSRPPPVIRASAPSRMRHWLERTNGDLWQDRSIRQRTLAEQEIDPADAYPSLDHPPAYEYPPTYSS